MDATTRKQPLPPARHAAAEALEVYRGNVAVADAGTARVTAKTWRLIAAHLERAVEGLASEDQTGDRRRQLLESAADATARAARVIADPPAIPETGRLSHYQVEAAISWLRDVNREDLVHFAGAAWRDDFDATVTRLALRSPGASEPELRRAARARHYGEEAQPSAS